MDKKQQKKDTEYEAPSDEIQAKITELMGLPIEEAAPTMSKEEAPNVVGRRGNSSVSKAAEFKQEAEIPKQDSFTNTITSNTNSQIESAETDSAVEDIVKSESDELLKQQDQQSSEFKIENKPKKTRLNIFTYWWRNKKLRNTTLGLVLIIVIGTFMIPTARYTALNAVGARASASFTVIDKISGRPVKNVNVTLANQTTTTANDGTVSFTGLKLGSADLILQKRSFEQLQTQVVLGWGSNPFEAPFEVAPTGTTFKFTITDWIDGEPIKEAEVTDDESVALADETGLANLTIEPTDDDLKIQISANGYRSEEIIIPAESTEPQQIKLTAAKPDIFISKRDGKYDLYKRDIDGKNEALILPATGNENNETYALGHPTDYNLAALVSSRQGNRNEDGYMLSDLYLVNISEKTAEKLETTQSERIRIIGWNGDYLVFVKTISGPSASLGNRQRIIVYDYKNNEQKELASANYFTDARLIKGKLYYVVSSGATGSQGVGLGRIDLDGNNRRALIGENIWALYRTDNDTLVVNADGDRWFKIQISKTKISQLEGAPASLQDVKLFDQQNGSKVARVEKRDGKTELLVKDTDSGKETLVLRQSGITLPIEWINQKTILYGVVTADETARYVVSINNNKAMKIGDNTESIYDGVLYY